MALLAGSQLAAHALQVTNDQSRLLADIFPTVPHIKRFNVRPGVARDILDSAELYLATMAVPYVLGLHEDYMSGCIDHCVESGLISRSDADGLRSTDIHEAFQAAASAPFAIEILELFHLLRRLRNCQIHSGGRVDRSLLNYLSRLSPKACALWETFTNEPIPSLQLGDEIVFRQGELAAALAVTKRLAEQANESLALVISRDKWADMMIADWAAEHGGQTTDRLQQLRKARTFAQQYYAPLALTDAEVGKALERAGYRPWPRTW